MSGVPQSEVDFDHCYPCFSGGDVAWVVGDTVTTQLPWGGRWFGRVEFAAGEDAAGEDAVVVVEQIDDRLGEVDVKVGDKILYKGAK